MKDGPGGEGGLQAGDVITRFNDHEIDSARALSLAVADVSPSASAKVTVWRDGKSRDLSVKLGEASKAEEVASNGAAGNDAATADLLGLTLRGLTDQDRARLGVPSDVNGALVVAVEPDSAAADKGLEPGDLITRVNQKPCHFRECGGCGAEDGEEGQVQRAASRAARRQSAVRRIELLVSIAASGA